MNLKWSKFLNLIFTVEIVKNTQFRKFYKRDDFPIQVQHSAGRKLVWKVDIEKLDFHYYLPMFFDGMIEMDQPYSSF